MNNNILSNMIQRAGPVVSQAIKTASHKTGVNFAYLMEQAAAESNFDEKAKAKTSSASGLFQFIESTWLNMIRDHGSAYGLSDFAKHIDEQGRVQDKTIRNEILALRKDPKIASYMAAEFADQNSQYLQRHLNKNYGDIGSTELYLAHFMGAGGATAFLNAFRDNPLATAADLFPKEARANYNVFYDSKAGKARSLAGVYEFFDKKFQASGDKSPASLTAENIPVQIKTPTPGYAALQNKLRLDHEILMMFSDSGTTKSKPSSFNPFSNIIASASKNKYNMAEILLLAQIESPISNINNSENKAHKGFYRN